MRASSTCFAAAHSDRLTPLDLPVLTEALGRSINVELAVWAFVAIGVVVRLSRYLLPFPLWCDEYQLADNFLGRGFFDLLRPLDNNQVAPIGFLWIELAAVKLLGFSELSLRLFPAGCAIASVFLFRHLAARVLAGAPLVLAMGIFAVAYFPIRHGAEVKPYASDLCVALVFFALLVEWWRAPEQSRWLWAMAGFTPLALAVSFPAVFVAGAVGLAVAWSLVTAWRIRSSGFRQSLPAFAAYSVVVGACFFALLNINVAAQYDATHSEMTKCWADEFPPLDRPWRLPLWLAEIHTGPMFAYPVGGEHGASLVTFACAVVALVSWWRLGRKPLTVAVAALFGLSLAAAAMHRYPYGGHARLSQYLAPAICLTAAWGAAVGLAALRRAAWRDAALKAVVVVCAGIGCGSLIRDVARPYKSRLDAEHRDFARRLWSDERWPRTVSVHDDLQIELYDNVFETGYRCYRRLFAPAASLEQGPARDPLTSVDGPVRCVVHHSASSPRRRQAFDDWMQQMLSRYELAGHEEHRLPLAPRQHRQFDYYLQCYDVYYFAPRTVDALSARPDSSAAK